MLNDGIRKVISILSAENPAFGRNKQCYTFLKACYTLYIERDLSEQGEFQRNSCLQYICQFEY